MIPTPPTLENDRPAEQAAAVAGVVHRLRRLAPPPAAAKGATEPERCELCAAPLAAEHSHLVEPARRRVVCACEPCAVLLGASADARYRRVPRSVRSRPNLRLTDEHWAALGVPIGLAFFYFSSSARRVVAAYPSPAGATEAVLAAEAWEALARNNPELGQLTPDAEALLVHRVGGARDCFLLPIDECYRLVGLVRTSWRGLSGGPAMWAEVAGFLERLRGRAEGGLRG